LALARRWCGERIARLPGSYVAYAPPAYAPAVGALAALRNGHVTFGFFNNVRKLTAGVVEAWSGILDRVPRSRLVLRTHAFGDPGVRRRYREMFDRCGSAGERASFHGEARHAEREKSAASRIALGAAAKCRLHGQDKGTSKNDLFRRVLPIGDGI